VVEHELQVDLPFESDVSQKPAILKLIVKNGFQADSGLPEEIQAIAFSSIPNPSSIG
jgi:hypothetical protein